MGQPSPMNLSLNLPEILLNIFDFLDTHSSSLAAAIQVNKQWFTCGTDVLWRKAPCEVLAKVPENRRQIYASKINALTFLGDDDAVYHSHFKDLQFSNLRKISLDAYRPGDSGHYYIRQYFQSPLEEFSFYGGDLDDDLLDHLRSTCWRLRKILIDSPGPRVTASSFLGFISEYKSLEHMEFVYGMDHLLTDELLLHLADRTNLLSLNIGKKCTKQVLDRITTEVPKPFTALQALYMPIQSSAVPLLLQLIKHCITRLHLEVKDSDVHVVQQLSSLPTLRNLSLSFAAPTQLSTAEIMSLTALPKLEGLGIGLDETEGAAGVTAFDSNFSDSDFDNLCSQFRTMRRICFQVQCSLSAAVLASLSRHCPFLEECTMSQTFDMQALGLENRRNVMFPRLRLLELGGFQAPVVNDQGTVGTYSSPHELASLMRRNFPKLEELYVSSNDDYSNAVVNSFSALKSS